MDAPPTGRISRFLNVSSEASGVARVGPIRGHADTVRSVIASPQTVVHFVSLLEEMPVQETLDGIAELHDVAHGGIRPGGIVVNMMREAEMAGTKAPGRPSLGSKTRGIHVLEIALKAARLGADHGLAADLAHPLADEAPTGRPQPAPR